MREEKRAAAGCGAICAKAGISAMRVFLAAAGRVRARVRHRSGVGGVLMHGDVIGGGVRGCRASCDCGVCRWAVHRSGSGSPSGFFFAEWGCLLWAGLVLWGILRISRTVERAFPGGLQLETRRVRCLGGRFSAGITTRALRVVTCHRVSLVLGCWDCWR